MTRFDIATGTMFVLAVLASPAAGAAQAVPPTTRVVPTSRSAQHITIDALTGLIELRSSRGTLSQSWSTATGGQGRAPLVAVPAGSPIEVEIVNANPLLYRYQLQTASVARRPLPSCSSLGNRLAATGFLTSFATVASLAQPVLAQGMAQLFQPPPAVQEAATRGEALLTPAAAAAALEAHREGLARYVRFLTAVQTLSVTLDDSLALVAELGESQPLDSLLSGLATSIESSFPGLSQSARIPFTLRQEHTAARSHLDALKSVARGITRGNFDGDASTGAAAEIVQLTTAATNAQNGLNATARVLQAKLLRVEQARLRTRQLFTLDASNDVRRLTLEISATAEYPEVFRSRVGQQELYAEPQVSLLCQLSLGVGFMSQPPDYAITNGVIDNQQSDQRSAVSVLLHVASRRLPVVGALAGFGFGTGGAPDLYAGGSVRALDPMMINVGVAWQRGPSLPNGFREGAPPPEPERMAALPRRYRPSFFWGVSLAR